MVVANAQTESNINTALAQAILNNANTVTPYGSSTTKATGVYNVDGHLIPQFTTTQKLNPQDQLQLDLQRQLGIDLTGLGSQSVDLISGALGSGFDLSGLPDLNTDFSSQAAAAEDAIYNRAAALLSPQFEQQNKELELQLSERGIPLGSEIYTTLTDQLSRQQNEALTGAALDAVLAGQARQSDLFGQTLQGRQQGFQEAAAINALPFNQLAALLGSAPGINTPQFNPFQPTGVAPTDVVGAYLGSAQIASNNYQTQANQPSLLGGLLGLGGKLGAAAIASDRRVKENFEPVESVTHKLKQLNVERFNYIGDAEKYIGPMAQDVERVFPEMVKEIDGVKYVDFLSLNGALLKGFKELYAEVEQLKMRANPRPENYGPGGYGPGGFQGRNGGHG